jgi:hypothetical protein
MPDYSTKVDHGALKANQLVIITLNLVAFIFDLRPIAALVAAAMVVGTAAGKPGFILVYRLLLKPLGIVTPVLIEDDPRPHRFAQGIGAVVMMLGSIALSLGSPVLGWIAVWIVACLAAVNVLAGFCVGCFLFYQLARLKVPGFSGAPPAGVFPGTRPRS